MTFAEIAFPLKNSIAATNRSKRPKTTSNRRKVFIKLGQGVFNGGL